eukprot:7825450-Pyramimonas_sp.AAC.1
MQWGARDRELRRLVHGVAAAGSAAERGEAGGGERSLHLEGPDLGALVNDIMEERCDVEEEEVMWPTWGFVECLRIDFC